MKCWHVVVNPLTFWDCELPYSGKTGNANSARLWNFSVSTHTRALMGHALNKSIWFPLATDQEFASINELLYTIPCNTASSEKMIGILVLHFYFLGFHFLLPLFFSSVPRAVGGSPKALSHFPWNAGNISSRWTPKLPQFTSPIVIGSGSFSKTFT